MRNVDYLLRSISFMNNTKMTQYTRVKTRAKNKKLPYCKRKRERARALRPANGLPVIEPTGFGSGRLAIQSDAT